MFKVVKLLNLKNRKSLLNLAKALLEDQKLLTVTQNNVCLVLCESFFLFYFCVLLVCSTMCFSS